MTVRHPAADMLTLELDGHAVPLFVRRSTRARRMSLKVEPQSDRIRLTLPRQTSLRDGLAFARSERVWLLRRLAELPPRVPFEDGARVPYRGCERRIRHVGRLRGTVALDDDEIRVPGLPEHLSRRLGDWLRGEARAAVAAASYRHAERLGVDIRRLAVRDMRSRWGSCSGDGRLSFCWRLILAPEWVLDYVAAHEVAHLRHMNHGPDFWREVRQLGVDARRAEAWLRAHGAALHRFGPANV